MGEFCYTYIQDSEENRIKLQELADLNSEDGMQIQLRTDSGKVVFTTSLN